MQKRIVFIALLLSGCASQMKPIPVPVMLPPPQEKMCEMYVGGKCKKFSASDISGATTLGNHDESILEENNR